MGYIRNNPLIRYKKDNFENNFCDLLTKLGVPRRVQSVIHTAFHEESESEVQNAKILEEHLKKHISNFQHFYFVNPIRGLHMFVYVFYKFCVPPDRVNPGLTPGSRV